MKLGGWAMWAGYVCRVIAVNDYGIQVCPVGFSSSFFLKEEYGFGGELYSISEQEAIILILKHNGRNTKIDKPA